MDKKSQLTIIAEVLKSRFQNLNALELITMAERILQALDANGYEVRERH